MHTLLLYYQGIKLKLILVKAHDAHLDYFQLATWLHERGPGNNDWRARRHVSDVTLRHVR